MKSNLIKFFLSFNLCVFSQVKMAENDLIKKKEINQEQSDLIYNHLKVFPNNTEVAFAFIKKDSVYFIGVKRVNDKIVWTENSNHVFEIGSITKVFTSTILANLVLEDKLKLESTIQSELTDINFKSKKEIKLVELANHTSGLPRLPSNMGKYVKEQNNPYKYFGEKELIEYLEQEMKLNQKPGLKQEYSNLGAGLLGYILIKNSRKDYEELLTDYIFSKYNMESSSIKKDKIKGNLVQGLDKDGKPTANWDLNILVGAGGIFSTVTDLAKFAQAQFNSENQELALTRNPTFNQTENKKTGLGWFISEYKSGNRHYWHNSGTGGYKSFMVIDPKNKNGIVVLPNVSGFSKNKTNIDQLGGKLMSTFYK